MLFYNRYNLARAKLEYLLSFAEGFAQHAQPDQQLANSELEEIKIMNTSLATRPRSFKGKLCSVKPADILDWLDGCSPDIQLPPFPLTLCTSSVVGDEYITEALLQKAVWAVKPQRWAFGGTTTASTLDITTNMPAGLGNEHLFSLDNPDFFDKDYVKVNGKLRPPFEQVEMEKMLLTLSCPMFFTPTSKF